MASEFDELIAYCRSGGRVCPVPRKWARLWKLLPDRRRQTDGGWQPSLPLILAAWSEATDEEKRERLELHIQWAAEHNVLEPVGEFLYALSDEEWHYSNR